MALRPYQRNFLERVKAAAPVSEALDVPAAVMVAQAIVESGWGRSGLAQKGNALFGIKATPSWPGVVYSGTTREWDGRAYVTYPGTNRVYPSYAAAIAEGALAASLFRAYPSWEQSIEDHARFFQENARYHPCLEQYRVTRDAQAFAVCIHTAGYATEPAYSQMLIAAMQQYAADLLVRPAASAPATPSSETPVAVRINGQALSNDYVRMVDGRVFIHVGVLRDLGYTVTWNGAERMVEVTQVA